MVSDFRDTLKLRLQPMHKGRAVDNTVTQPDPITGKDACNANLTAGTLLRICWRPRFLVIDDKSEISTSCTHIEYIGQHNTILQLQMAASLSLVVHAVVAIYVISQQAW